jgi:hypothetical protein
VFGARSAATRASKRAAPEHFNETREMRQLSPRRATLPWLGGSGRASARVRRAAVARSDAIARLRSTSGAFARRRLGSRRSGAAAVAIR